MNTTVMARTAYSANANTIRTPRSTEYQAFAGITARIKAAHARGGAGFAMLAQALHDNRRLWTILAGDVADRENGLTQDLRARIFYLAEFTLRHTPKVLAGNATPEVLVDINTAVMAGLSGARIAS